MKRPFDVCRNEANSDGVKYVGSDGQRCNLKLEGEISIQVMKRAADRRSMLIIDDGMSTSL